MYFWATIRKGVTFSIGVFISVLTVCTSATSNYIINSKLEAWEESDWSGTNYYQQLGADIIFHACVNLVGWLLRYVSDINMRRGFLDKRGCIETTFRLKFEKKQEESLLLSIIPKHIASSVADEIKKFIDNLDHERHTKQFRFVKLNHCLCKTDNKIIFSSETFIETHKNVSILFADICNFTPLTEKFTTKTIIDGKEVSHDRTNELVSTLNDLFGKFDNAAEVFIILC